MPPKPRVASVLDGGFGNVDDETCASSVPVSGTSCDRSVGVAERLSDRAPSAKRAVKFPRLLVDVLLVGSTLSWHHIDVGTHGYLSFVRRLVAFGIGLRQFGDRDSQSQVISRHAGIFLRRSGRRRHPNIYFRMGNGRCLRLALSRWFCRIGIVPRPRPSDRGASL